MTGTILLILIAVFAIGYYMGKNKRVANNKHHFHPAAKVDNEKLMADVKRLTALGEVIRQAQEHGDVETYQAALADKYDGDLPTLLPDGSWTNLYMHQMTFSIAGINFRSGIREKLGINDIFLVPEPDNPHDPKAIKVMSSDGIHLGYVPASLTEKVRMFTLQNFPYPGTATITEETDDEDSTRTFFTGEVVITYEDFLGPKIK